MTAWACAPGGRAAARADRPARSPTRSIYVLDRACSRCRSACRASCTSAGCSWRAATTGRPDLTAERFVPNPFLKDAGGRMKDEERPIHPSSFILHPLQDRRPGPLPPDGSDRVPGPHRPQVKMRGFRIELGEIEAALGQHAARARGGGRGCARTRRAASGWWPTWSRARASGAREELRRRSPRQQTAARVHGAGGFRRRSTALPLTPNGKLDRKALPAPEGRARRLARKRCGAGRRPLSRCSRRLGGGARRRQVGIRATSSRSAANRSSASRSSRCSASAAFTSRLSRFSGTRLSPSWRRC